MSGFIGRRGTRCRRHSAAGGAARAQGGGRRLRQLPAHSVTSGNNPSSAAWYAGWPGPTIAAGSRRRDGGGLPETSSRRANARRSSPGLPPACRRGWCRGRPVARAGRTDRAPAPSGSAPAAGQQGRHGDSAAGNGAGAIGRHRIRRIERRRCRKPRRRFAHARRCAVSGPPDNRVGMADGSVPRMERFPFPLGAVGVERRNRGTALSHAAC